MKVYVRESKNQIVINPKELANGGNESQMQKDSLENLGLDTIDAESIQHIIGKQINQKAEKILEAENIIYNPENHIIN